MTDYELHEPDFTDTTRDEWDAPQQDDLETDDLSAIDGHFLLSASGFPPDNFTDLKLPVVNPDGDLNVNALQTARGGGHSVEAVENLDDETERAAKELIEDLAQEEFDQDIGD